MLVFAAALMLAAPAEDAPPVPERVSTLVVYGKDSCPRSSGDEIVVCARQPESERYRIPKRFRNKVDRSTSAGAWSNRFRELEYVGRDGMPNSCSATGSNGQTGCFSQFLAQSRAERAEAKREAESSVP